MTENHLAVFHGIELSIIDHEGQRWLTADQLARCLGYSEANGRAGINRLYSRNADEFAAADTCVINLTSNPGFAVNLTSNQGGNPNTRIFSATGCNLLSFFSATPKAKEFRAWAKQVLAREQATALSAAPRQPGAPATQASVDAIAAKVDGLGAAVAQMAQVTGAAMTQMAASMDTLAQGTAAVQHQLHYTGRYVAMLELNQRGTARITREIEAQTKALFAEGVSRANIARALRISRTSVSCLINGNFTWSASQIDRPALDVQHVLELMISKEQGSLLAIATTGAAS